MGVIQRFKDIMSANINALLDKAEDPSKMIDQYMRNLQEDLQKVFENLYQQAAQAQQYYQQGIPQQMPIPPQQQQNEEGGFFSSPTVKMVGVGVACAAAGYLGHKYMSASDSAEVAAALGELL